MAPSYGTSLRMRDPDFQGYEMRDVHMPLVTPSLDYRVQFAVIPAHRTPLPGAPPPSLLPVVTGRCSSMELTVSSYIVRGASPAQLCYN